MLIIELQFLAGRYHATPWGHNVNEGIVEWPPSPFRLARALVDLAKRRRPDWDDDRLAAVLKTLEKPLGFRLPPAAASHTRSYLSSNDKDPLQKQKILDAFVVVDREERVLAAFDAAPDAARVGDLDELLSEMNYFGRSESWARAKIREEPEVQLNCVPADDRAPERDDDRVRVACLRPEPEYEALEDKPTRGRKKRSAGRGKARAGEPRSWLEAICLSSGELLHDGWSEPPGQKTVAFLRSARALQPRPRPRRMALDSRFRLARYALHGAVLPRVTQTVPFAERARVRLMGIHKAVMGGDPTALSPLFHGKDAAGQPQRGHAHVYLLPRDEDGDGRIDHLVIRAERPFDATELQALDRLRRVHQSGGRPELTLVLAGLGDGSSSESHGRWVSSTPFVTARHHRRGRGTYLEWLTEEVRRECEYHGLPRPVAVEWISHTPSSGHQLRWMEFVRSRKDRRPLRGHGCILDFPEPIVGPIAIGALAHFGLGQFVPYSGPRPHHR